MQQGMNRASDLRPTYIFKQHPGYAQAVLSGLPQEPEDMMHLARELQHT